MGTRKILYSPGYGAGWTTWETNEEMKKFMLTYKPLIEAIERDEPNLLKEPRLLYKLPKKRKPVGPIIGGWDFDGCHPIVIKFAEECMERFGDVPYMGGLDDLKVATVEGRVKIDEYDGFESFIEEDNFSGWL